jgi:hypothetical protein
VCIHEPRAEVHNADRIDAARSKTDTEHREGIVPEKRRRICGTAGSPCGYPIFSQVGRPKIYPESFKEVVNYTTYLQQDLIFSLILLWVHGVSIDDFSFLKT